MRRAGPCTHRAQSGEGPSEPGFLLSAQKLGKELGGKEGGRWPCTDRQDLDFPLDFPEHRERTSGKRACLCMSISGAWRGALEDSRKQHCSWPLELTNVARQSAGPTLCH
jgi:hypothetical protein